MVVVTTSLIPSLGQNGGGKCTHLVSCFQRCGILAGNETRFSYALVTPIDQRKDSVHDHVSNRFFANRSADVPGTAAGLRAIAIFEASKGVLVLVAGLGLLSLIHHGGQNVAEEIVRLFHLNPAHHHPRILIDAATHINDSHLRLLALAALVYSAVRFIEAYGLWRMRAWAEWFAIVSGAVYIPLELYELVRRATVVKAAVLVVNTGIVAYLIYVRWFRNRSSRLNPSSTSDVGGENSRRRSPTRTIGGMAKH